MQHSSFETTKSLFWKIVFYFSLSIATLWLILKLLGIIQTPVWLEFGVPIATLILGAFSLYQNFIDRVHHILTKLEAFDYRFVAVENDLGGLQKEIRGLRKRTMRLEEKVFSNSSAKF